MDIETLMEIEITSVAKKPQNLSDSAAAVFVITAENIRSSGVTNIPDALRMVPGVNVARIDSNKWAVSVRGFNSRFSDKLLVLMDGRSLYTPSYAGVYWEAQDTMIEDIERIEVIRGPGATLWGANAVNGVINIITKHAADTLGGLVTTGGGPHETAFARARYGAMLGEGIFGRLYVKGDRRNELDLEDNERGAGDDWSTLRSGFRVDGAPADDSSFTVQGDIYKGEINQRILLPDLKAPYSYTVDDEGEMSGGNVQIAWDKILSPTSNITVKAYYDRTERKEVFAHEETDCLDLELQHRFTLGERNDIVWGTHYRYTADKIHENDFISSLSEHSSLYSFFVQDEISLLKDRLLLTLGSKFEHNDHTGYEIQPSARIMWRPHERHKVWASVSRAVRTPSNIERYGTLTSQVLPPYYLFNTSPLPLLTGITGDEAFDSQEVTAYELGYRLIAASNLSIDIALFHNEYDDLRYFETAVVTPRGDHLEGYSPFANGKTGSTCGVEVSAAWQPADRLKLDAAYSWFREDLPDFFDSDTYINESPTHQFSLRGSWKVSDRFTADAWLRYVDGFLCAYPTASSRKYEIDDYLTADLQLTWHPSGNISCSLVGRNLFDSGRVEYVQEYYTSPAEVEREVYGKITYRF